MWSLGHLDFLPLSLERQRDVSWAHDDIFSDFVSSVQLPCEIINKRQKKNLNVYCWISIKHRGLSPNQRKQAQKRLNMDAWTQAYFSGYSNSWLARTSRQRYRGRGYWCQRPPYNCFWTGLLKSVCLMLLWVKCIPYDTVEKNLLFTLLLLHLEGQTLWGKRILILKGIWE